MNLRISFGTSDEDVFFTIYNMAFHLKRCLVIIRMRD